MRFHRVLYFGVLAFGAAAPLVAFGQFQAPTQEELKMTSDPKNPGADAIILYREEIQDDDHNVHSYYDRIKVLTEKGKELATVQIAYQRHFSYGDRTGERDAENRSNDVDRISGHFEIAAVSGRTIHPDGIIVPLTATPADLMDVKKGENQINRVTINLPSVEVGSILEYRYQLRIDNRFVATPPSWQVQQPYPVRKAHYLFIPNHIFAPTTGGAGVGGGYMVDGHGQPLSDLLATPHLTQPKLLVHDALGRYSLDISDVPPIPREAYSPPLQDQIMQVNFYYSPSFVQKEYWQKEMQYWNKDVHSYTAETGAIKQAANEVASASDSPLDKAKKLYDLVQKLDNTDYSQKTAFTFFSGSLPAGNVDAVLDKKSGNSDQVALLYLALAHAAGLNARADRISSRDRRTFAADFLNSDQLDAIVIELNIDGKPIFVDPGEKMAPFQTLAWAHSGAGGVAIGAGDKVESVVTPLPLNTDNSVFHVGKLTINPDGTVSGALKVAFTGQEALHWRQLSLREDLTNVTHRMERTIAETVPDGIQIHVDRIANLDDPSKQLIAVVTATGPLAQHAGTHLLLPRLFFDTKESDPFPSEESRSLPIDMHYPEQEQEQVTYLLPAGYTVEGAPPDASLKWEENYAYQLRSKVDPTSITTARILARGFTVLDAKDYGALRDFYEKVVVSDHQQIALTAPKTGGQ
ncbi:MAG: DUF3857 domain-containing protein [Terracidiphilus sp.]|jgi:hypothetical protein